MKLYRVASGLRLEPFDDPVGECLVGGVTLDQALADNAGHCSLQLEAAASSAAIPPRGSYLLAPDSLYLSRAALRRFLELVPREAGLWRLALRRGPATDYCLPLQQVQYDAKLYYTDLYLANQAEVPQGLTWPDLRDWLRERARVVELDPGGDCVELTLSRPGPPRQKLALPRTTVLAVDISHWVHLLWLNHLLPWLLLEQYRQDQPGWRRAWRGLGLIARNRVARGNIIGPGCDIHPTAHVEGSLLGPGVKLGPFAFVRESILGAGVEVSDHSKFTRCVVGEGCHTLNDSLFINCTFYPGSTLASFLLRNSLIGRQVFLTSGVMFWDEPMQGTVPVLRNGREVDSGRYLLGGCAGHRCLLGTRAIFLPGRAVPNDTIIVMRPEEGVFKLPAQVQAGRPHVYHQGRIVPLRQVLPEFSPPEIEP